MFQQILVPLDGTLFAESALGPARELARLFGSKLVIVRAEDIAETPHGSVQVDQQAALERVGEVDAYLHEVVEALSRDGYQADLVLSLEAPAIGIADAAAARHADLVVLATHLRWNAALVQQVSTTLQLLTHSHVPLLIWRSSPMSSLAGQAGTTDGAHLLSRPHLPIVVPLDGSTLAEEALPHAGALAHALDTPLVLVRAVDVALPEREELDHVRQAPLLRALSAAEAYLEQRQQALRSRGVAATTLSRVGSPLGVIDGALREYNASLIVMAGRGETGQQGSLLGSIAAQLIEEVEVPILVVHPDVTPDIC